MIIQLLGIILVTTAINSSNPSDRSQDDILNSYLHKLVRYYQEVFVKNMLKNVPRNLYSSKSQDSDHVEQTAGKVDPKMFIPDEQNMLSQNQLNTSGFRDMFCKDHSKNSNSYTKDEEKNNEMYYKLFQKIHSDTQFWKADPKHSDEEMQKINSDEKQKKKNQMIHDLLEKFYKDSPVSVSNGISGTSRRLWDPHAFLSSRLRGDTHHHHKAKVGRSRYDDEEDEDEDEDEGEGEEEKHRYQGPRDMNAEFYVVNPLNSKLHPGHRHKLQSIVDDLREKASWNKTKSKKNETKLDRPSRSKRQAVSTASKYFDQQSRRERMAVPTELYNFDRRDRSRHMAVPKASKYFGRRARSRHMTIPKAAGFSNRRGRSRRVPAASKYIDQRVRRKRMAGASRYYNRRARRSVAAQSAANIVDCNRRAGCCRLC